MANDVLTTFSAHEAQLIKALREIEAHIRAVPDRKTVHLEAKLTKARAELKRFEEQLRTIRDETVDVDVRMTAQGLLADTAKVKAALATIPENKVITLTMREKISATLARAESRILSIGKSVQKLSNAAPSVGPWDKFTGSLSRVALQLRRLPAFISGIAIAMFTALLPAVLAVTAALGGLVAGIGAAAAALAGALIPAIGVAVSLMGRLTKVMAVRQELEQAHRQDAAKSAAATDNQAASERRLVDAARAVADAQRAQGLASQELQDATEALSQAAQDAFWEMVDAARAARDAMINVRDARIGLDEARLGVEEAQLALKEFRNGIGLTGDAFDQMFKKFTNVNFQFDEGALQKILGDTGQSKDDQIELESLILRVRRAKLQEDEATNQLKDSEQDVARARQENAKFLRDGIAASATYQAALGRVESAERSYNDAVRTTNRARKDAASTNKEVARSTEDLSTGLARARADFKRLSPEEQAFIRAMERADGAVARFKKRVAAPIFGAFTQGLNSLPGLLNKVQLPLVLLANTWANLGKQFAGHVAKKVTDNFAILTVGALGLSTSFTSIFTSLFDLIINVARGAMPLLLSAVHDIAESFKGWSKGTSNAQKVQDTLKPMFTLMRAVVGIVVNLGRALVNAFIGGSGPINDFIQWIERGIKAFADFLGSAKGKEQVREFFEDTLPFVKSLIKFLVRFGVALLKALQIVLPILKPTLDFFIFLVDALILVLRAIDFLIGPFKELIGVFVSLALGGGILGKFFQLLRFAGLALFGTIAKLVQEFGGLARVLIFPFRVAISWLGRAPALFGKVIGGIVRAVSSVWGRIAGVFRRPVERGFGIVRGIFETAKGWVGAAIRAIVGVFEREWRGIKVIIGWVLDRFRSMRDLVIKIFEGLGRGIAAAFRGVKDTIKGILNVIINLANDFIGAWNSVFGKERKIKGPGPLPDITLPGLHLGEIPKLAAGGVVSRGTMFQAGEGSSSEAVLPLTRGVFQKLGTAIAKALAPKLQPSFASMGSLRNLNVGSAPGVGRSVIEKVDVHLPAPPAGGIPDPRYSAALLAKEIKRRGW